MTVVELIVGTAICRGPHLDDVTQAVGCGPKHGSQRIAELLGGCQVRSGERIVVDLNQYENGGARDPKRDIEAEPGAEFHDPNAVPIASLRRHGTGKEREGTKAD
jgi:hypothetical protein